MTPARRTVAVAGEALVDLLVQPDGSARLVPGGGPFNAARALARLGEDVTFLGRLSGDRFGERLRSILRADGVRLADLAPSPHPTTLAIAELDDVGTASYTFHTAETSAGDLTADELRGALPAELAALHVGTLGLVLEPHAGAVEAAVRSLADDVVVLVDPNCRPAVVVDRGAYLARLHRVLARADLVKVSGDDVAYLDPTRAPVDVARDLLAAGPATVLLTDGGEAVRVLHRDGEVVVPVPVVEVVDTVGAGDAFGAGVLHRWLASGAGRAELSDLAAVVDAVAYGTVVAAATCAQVGADPPTVQQVAAFRA